MSLNVLEVAVYAMVLLGAGQQNFVCESNPTGVRCSHGLAAFPSDNDSIMFSDGTRISKGPRRQVQFSNGLTNLMDAAGWVQFSNGIGFRRDTRVATRIRFTNGASCEQVGETVARCKKG
jgi:hypothetical protein